MELQIRELRLVLLGNEANSPGGLLEEERLHQQVIDIEFHLAAPDPQSKFVRLALNQASHRSTVPACQIKRIEMKVYVPAELPNLRLSPLRLTHLQQDRCCGMVITSLYTETDIHLAAEWVLRIESARRDCAFDDQALFQIEVLVQHNNTLTGLRRVEPRERPPVLVGIDHHRLAVVATELIGFVSV